MPKCSICKLAPDILDAVNRKIRDKESDVGIAQDLDLSRDSIRRHRIKGHHLRPEDKAQRALQQALHQPPEIDRRDVTLPEVIDSILQQINYFNAAWKTYAEHGAIKSAGEINKELRQTWQLLSNLKGWLKTDSTVVQVQVNTMLNHTAQKLYSAVEGCPRCMARLEKVLMEESERDVTP